MASASEEFHESVNQFMARHPPQELVDALKSFLHSPIPTVRETTWLPPADEVAVREDLARQLLSNLDKFEGLNITASQASILLVAPLDVLRYLVNNTKPDPSIAHAWAYREALCGLFKMFRDLLRYFLQGQHPDAANRKRKSPGQKPQPVEGGKESIARSERERNKCLFRDDNTCIFTRGIHPEACHIVPFSFNSTKKNMVYTRAFSACLRMFFPNSEVQAYRDLLKARLGCSDKSWNMLAINPYLHAWWGKPHWGVECTGIVPRDGKYAVVVVFWWLPHGKGDAKREINMELGQGGFRRLLDDLSSDGPSYGRGQGPDMQGYATGVTHDTFRPIISGQEFAVVHDTLDDALNMRKMLDIEWACVRVAALAGAAGPNDFDDGFSEFSFELEDFERDLYLSGPIPED